MASCSCTFSAFISVICPLSQIEHRGGDREGSATCLAAVYGILLVVDCPQEVLWLMRGSGRVTLPFASL